MVDSDENRACEDAAAYYHDFLFDSGDPSLPRSVTDHIKQCRHCLAEIARLEQILAEAEEGASQADDELISRLQRHFEYIGDEVGCRQVKPLLPTLLLPSVRIRIPTPVTVHVDHCAECIRDLAALKGLGLDEEQLIRLSRLYEDCLADDSRTCLAAVYERRQELLDLRHRDGSSDSVSCDRGLSMADLFDYAVPYEGAGANGAGGSGRDEEVATHVRSCPACLEKLQILYQVVLGTIDRADTNVVTVYTASPVGRGASEPSEQAYAAHPIEVQVADIGPATAGPSRSATGARAILARSVAGGILRPVVKTAFLAAAMIPLAVVFWVSTRSASGLSVRHVSNIVADAPVVHVVTYHGLEAEPTQEVWYSSGRQTVVYEDSAGRAVYDLAERRKYASGPVLTPLRRVDARPGEFRRIRRMMQYRLGLDLRSLDAGLERLDDGSVTDGADEVYELCWEEMDSRGRPVPRRWRVFVDPATRRPRKTEYYVRLTPDSGWELDTTRHFAYPSEMEVADRIGELLEP